YFGKDEDRYYSLALWTGPLRMASVTRGAGGVMPDFAGTTTLVGDTDGLWAALKGAQSGDTIELAAGNYAALRLDSANIAGNVTVTSVDPTHPAVIAGMTLTSSSGMTFSNITFTVDPNTGFAVQLG